MEQFAEINSQNIENEVKSHVRNVVAIWLRQCVEQRQKDLGIDNYFNRGNGVKIDPMAVLDQKEMSLLAAIKYFPSQ